jgi:hypothetical protein
MLTQRSLLDDPSVRCIVDYSLARRAALHQLKSGQVRPEDACDAQMYLRRAARYHGLPTQELCPVCRHADLTLVLYAFSDFFPDAGNGRARARKELRDLAAQIPELTVFNVEVCLGCGWNFLTSSCVLGTGEQVAPPRRRSHSGSRG